MGSKRDGVRERVDPRGEVREGVRIKERSKRE